MFLTCAASPVPIVVFPYCAAICDCNSGLLFCIALIPLSASDFPYKGAADIVCCTAEVIPCTPCEIAALRRASAAAADI